MKFQKLFVSYWRGPVLGKSSAMMLGLLISAGVAQAQLRTAVDPLARSEQTNTTVSFFASYANGGDTALSNCQTSLASDIPASLNSFDPGGDDPLAPFSLAPSETRDLILKIEPSAAFPSRQVFFDFVCEDPEGASVKAPTIPGVNVIVLTASDTPTADVVAWASEDLLTANPSDAFAVNAINFGVGAQITVVPNTGATQLPLILSVCELDTVNGTCLTTPAPSVTTTIDELGFALFGVFATSEGTISFDAANSRIFFALSGPAG